MTYSRVVPVEELSGPHLDALGEYHGVDTRDDARGELSDDPVIEVGREDGRRVGGNAVIRPCPFCEAEHTHKFREALEEGRLVQHASECPRKEIYWLVWFGKGKGNWRDEDKYADEPGIDEE